MKTDVEELSPTRVKLSIEVPFDELKPSLDKAYREIGPPGAGARLPARPGAAADHRSALRPRPGPRADRQRRPARAVRQGTPGGRRDRPGPARAGDHQARRRQGALVHRGGGHPAQVRGARPRGHAGHRGQRRGEPGRRRGVPRRPAGALRLAQGRRTGPRSPGTSSPSTCPPRWTGRAWRMHRPAGCPTRSAPAPCWTGSTRRWKASRPDESRVFTAELPGGAHTGEQAEITVTVHSVKVKDLPELDDEFAQAASEFDTLGELRAGTRTQLEGAHRLQQASQAQGAGPRRAAGQDRRPVAGKGGGGRGRAPPRSDDRAASSSSAPASMTTCSRPAGHPPSSRPTWSATRSGRSRPGSSSTSWPSRRSLASTRAR